MSTTVVSFPFDQFGSPGTSTGARLLVDGVREMLADNRRETRATRARAYDGQVRIRELAFDTMPQLRAWRERGQRAVQQALDAGPFLWLGGNHLSALPVYEELGRRKAVVVQFDAHLDLYHQGDCTAELSHGNFLRHLSEPRPKIFHVGHRDLFLPQKEIDEHFEIAIGAHSAAIESAACVRLLRDLTYDESAVFIDLDCDALDPTFFPAVAHPMPFGLSPTALLQLIDAVGFERIIGLGISEFDPGRDVGDRSLALLLWLIEYFLLGKHEAR